MPRMRIQYWGLFVAAIMAGALFFATSASAKGIKERMRDRLSVIVSLKAKGVVGENNKGFLELLKGKTEKKEVVAAENKDRELIYGEIAKKTGTDVKLVGQRRASQIAAKASPGDWLQDAAGKWYKK